MDRYSIVLRAANPNSDDGLAFARYADQAAEGFLRFMLGRHAGRIIATAFVQPDNDLSYQHATFAERDNVIVGMVSGFTAEQHSHASRHALTRAAGRFNLRLKVVRLLFAPLMHVIDSIADGDFYVHTIAVDQALRGAGVGSILMDFLEDRARTIGSTRLSLDVSAKNAGARRFYERRGMNIEFQWPRRLAIPGIKLYRMTKVL